MVFTVERFESEEAEQKPVQLFNRNLFTNSKYALITCVRARVRVRVCVRARVSECARVCPYT